MKMPNFFIASGLRPHYSLGSGSHRPFIASGILISIIGAAMLVFLTAFGTDPAEGENPRTKANLDAVAGAPSSPGIPALAILTLSTNDDLLPDIAAAAGGIPGIIGVAEIRTATRWLSGWNETGQPVNLAPPGHLIPMDVGSMDPAEYQGLLPASDRETFLDLADNAAIISRTAATLRNIENDGFLHFLGEVVRVVAVVDDELTRHHEAIVTHPTGDRLGGGQNRYLEIGLDSLGEAQKIETELRRLVPPGVPAKIRGPLGSGIGDPGGLLSTGEIKSVFGEFPAVLIGGGNIRIPQEWIDKHTSLETVPLLGEFRCHKDLFAQIRGAIAHIEREGLGMLINRADFGGCFSPRFIRMGDSLSRHSWGIAIDFNVSRNLMGHPPTMDPGIVKIMEEWGFSWGGNWGIPDGMHFEFVRKRPQ